MNNIADPDVVEHKLADEDEFLVLACDGKVSRGHKFFCNGTMRQIKYSKTAPCMTIYNC